MRRREFIALVGAATWTLSAGAQQTNTRRIGYVDSWAPDDFAGGTVLRQGMRELGYVEGRDYIFERRATAGEYQRIRTSAFRIWRQETCPQSAF